MLAFIDSHYEARAVPRHLASDNAVSRRIQRNSCPGFFLRSTLNSERSTILDSSAP